MFETRKDLCQSDRNSKANMTNAPAVANLTLLVSANVNVKELFSDREVQSTDCYLPVIQ
jgi:hypothetical protein